MMTLKIVIHSILPSVFSQTFDQGCFITLLKSKKIELLVDIHTYVQGFAYRISADDRKRICL